MLNKKQISGKKLFAPAVVLGIASYFFLKGNGSESLKPENFEMSEVRRGTLTYEVTATGTINPINTVTVGTQVSGIVETVLADYNDDVKKGQVLALLDASTLKETMEKSYASYELAQAKERKAKLNYDRIKKLYQDKLTSSASLEDAEIEYKEASANVLSAKADYNIAKKNFEYITYATPNTGAYDLLDDGLKNNKALFPDLDKLPNCEIIQYLGDDVDTIYNDMWKEIKSE